MDRFTYKERIYNVIHYKAKMKIGQVWVTCVVYQDVEDLQIYVRETIDFHEKFNFIGERGHS